MKKMLAMVPVLLLAVLLLAACGGTPSSEPTLRPTANRQTDVLPTAGAGMVYVIADYYDESGGFSASGLSLDEKDSEKVLTVKAGDTLVVADRQYGVAAEALTLPFYTQSSLDEVTFWWTDYCASRIERGELTDVTGR